jgi:hypothetical protein
MRWLAYILLVTIASSAPAQTVVDGSDKGISAEEIKNLLRIVGGSLRDPASAQIDRLKKLSEGNICGRANAKTTRGGYAGFRAFSVNLKGSTGRGAVAFVAKDEGQFERNALLLPETATGACVQK